MPSCAANRKKIKRLKRALRLIRDNELAEPGQGPEDWPQNANGEDMTYDELADWALSEKID